MESGKGSGSGGGGGESCSCSRAVDFSALPEGCIAHIFSFTTPQDVCRFSGVSSAFRSAAQSDAVWDTFLPSSDVISQIPPSFASKKEAFFHFCHHPILINNGTKSFWLDKRSGKKCYMLSPRDLCIVWGDTPAYWRWPSSPEARFAEVAELVTVCWLEIRGKIDTAMLSPATSYAAYLVFKPTAANYGFQHQPVEAAVGLAGTDAPKKTVYLDAMVERAECAPWRPRHPVVRRGTGGLISLSRRRIIRMEEPAPAPAPAPAPRVVRRADEDCCRPKPVERGDGWWEIELGEFLYDGVATGDLEVGVFEVKGGNWKGGLLVQGIEIRPKFIKSK